MAVTYPKWVETAKSGDKVVCTSMGGPRHATDLNIGGIYTISEISYGEGQGVTDDVKSKCVMLFIEGHLFNPETNALFGYVPSDFDPVSKAKGTFKEVGKLNELASKITDTSIQEPQA